LAVQGLWVPGELAWRVISVMTTSVMCPVAGGRGISRWRAVVTETECARAVLADA
jgi:hypothetical protein